MASRHFALCASVSDTIFCCGVPATGPRIVLALRHEHHEEAGADRGLDMEMRHLVEMQRPHLQPRADETIEHAALDRRILLAWIHHQRRAAEPRDRIAAGLADDAQTQALEIVELGRLFGEM